MLDSLIKEFDTALRTLLPPIQRVTQTPLTTWNQPEPSLTLAQKKHTQGLMRVNHAGEVCAQALYQGQALTAKKRAVQEHMAKAAMEEVDHLGWCETRLQELQSHPSYLNPLWYAGSFFLRCTRRLGG